MSNPAVEYAQRQIGKPYVFATPRPITTEDRPTYDCSGLTSCCWLTLGKHLTPYTVTCYAELAAMGLLHPTSQAGPGDLIFWKDTTGYIYHMAIVESPGTLIEAPQPGQNVQRRGYSTSDTDLMKSCGACPVSGAAAGAGGVPAALVGAAGPSTAVGVLGAGSALLGATDKATRLLRDPRFWRRAGMFTLGAAVLGGAGYYWLENG